MLNVVAASINPSTITVSPANTEVDVRIDHPLSLAYLDDSFEQADRIWKVEVVKRAKTQHHVEGPNRSLESSRTSQVTTSSD